jgi:hypothetical protein
MTQFGLFDAPPATPSGAATAPPVKLNGGRPMPQPDELGDWTFRVEGTDRQRRSHAQFLVRSNMRFAAAAADATNTALRVLGFATVDHLVVLG